MLFDCFTCRATVDEPNVRNNVCSTCFTKRQMAAFQKLCPPLYIDTDIARLPNQYAQVMAWQFGSHGLLLTGNTGTCKTRCAWMLVKKMMLEGRNVSVFDCVSFGHEISLRFRTEDGDPEKWLEKMSRRDLVFFDDLGKLKLTDRAEAELFGVIERRCANKLPLIATTNDTGTTLADRMTDNRGPAMIRRLREFCSVVQF